MIDFIKKATDKNETCICCGCKFMYESKDIYRETTGLIDYEKTIDYVICP